MNLKLKTMGAPLGNCNAAKNKSACAAKISRYGKTVTNKAMAGRKVKSITGKKRSVSEGAKSFLKKSGIAAANRDRSYMNNPYGYYNKTTKRFEY